MGIGNTNRLPGRGRAAFVPEIRAPGLPFRVPGGIDGPVAIPSRIAFPLRAGGPRGGLVKGGANGTVNLFTPSIDKMAPYYLGNQSGNNFRNGIKWLRGRFNNTAGITQFIPYEDATPNQTSNMPNVSERPPNPLGDIPFSRKGFNYGGLRRGFNIENARYRVLPRYVIQRPAQINRTVSQPQQNAPYQPKLTRMVAASAYGQTTKTLLPAAIADALSQYAKNGRGGDQFGGY